MVNYDEDDADNNNSNENVAGYAWVRGPWLNVQGKVILPLTPWDLAFAFIICFHEMDILSAAPVDMLGR
jgi:hypothetical protein